MRFFLKTNLFIKFVVASAILLIICAYVKADAATQNDFTMSIVTPDGYAREFDGVAYIPFDTEYEILLKNNTDRLCSARVFIDGARVSPTADFVIHANDEIKLERFLIDHPDGKSVILNKGPRFKFVPLSNPKVDDPTRETNGVVRVEFKREKRYAIYLDGDWSDITYLDTSATNATTTLSSAEFNALTSTTMTTSNGATVPGSESNQKFKLSDHEFEDTIAAEIKIQLMGLDEGTFTIDYPDDSFIYELPSPLDLYKFSPQKDITAYELSKILERAGLEFFLESTDDLPKNIKRHLKKE